MLQPYAVGPDRASKLDQLRGICDVSHIERGIQLERLHPESKARGVPPEVSQIVKNTAQLGGAPDGRISDRVNRIDRNGEAERVRLALKE